jgi:putative FmdB family regulatory protein
MPTYGYICECGYEFEIFQSFSDESLTDCPECGKTKLSKKLYAPIVFVKQEPTTLGHQAARNTEQLGRYEYEAKMHERKQRIKKASDELLKETKGRNIEHTGELPWWRAGVVPGLPKEERPISIDKAKKIAKEIGIQVTEPPKPRPKV